MDKKYIIKTNQSVAVITLHDQSFSVFAEALSKIKKPEKKEIWMMQSVEKKGEPFRVFIVFKF